MNVARFLNNKKIKCSKNDYKKIFGPEFEDVIGCNCFNFPMKLYQNYQLLSNFYQILTSVK